MLSASSNDDKIAWYPNDGAANFSDEQIVIQMQLTAPEVVCTADLDNDGFTDIISTSYSPTRLVWFRNNGDDTFNEPSFIANNVYGASLVYAADMDTDGDKDVAYIVYTVVGVGDVEYSMFWVENDGTGNFIATHNIYYAESLEINFNIADLDNDGDVDLFIHNNGTLSYYLNNGTGNFTSPQIIATAIDNLSSLNTADIDNDGYQDILFASSTNNSIIWYKNNGNATFSTPQIIANNVLNIANMVTADLNNDNNTDILWTGNNTVEWILNNGNNTFGEPQIISDQVAYARKVLAADVDNDGDIDVLSASISTSSNPLTTANKIVWFSNNGDGTFAPEEIITTNISNIQSIATADLDNDGDLDLASASYDDNKVAWYENLLSYLPPPATTPPTASFNTYPTTTDTLYICQGQTVYFNNTSQNATNYNWTFGDGTQSNDSNPAHTFNTPGTHEVALVASNITTQAPCITTIDDTFEVDFSDAVTLSVLDNDIICTDDYQLSLLTYPSNGVAAVNGYNTIVYVSIDAAFIGQTCFSYVVTTSLGSDTAQVCLLVGANCIINLQADQLTIAPPNTSISLGGVSNNDIVLGCNGLPEYYLTYQQPNYGTITYAPFEPMSPTYTPNPGFIGTDCFEYYVIGNANGVPIATSQVCITVTN